MQVVTDTHRITITISSGQISVAHPSMAPIVALGFLDIAKDIVKGELRPQVAIATAIPGGASGVPAQ